MTKNSNKTSDGAQEAISEVAQTLKFDIEESISWILDGDYDYQPMVEDIEDLKSCTTLEELKEVMDNLSRYKELPSLDDLLLEEGYDSLEDMVGITHFNIEFKEGNKV